MSTNLLLVDTSLNCLTLTSLLRTERDLKVIGASNNADTAREKIINLHPDYMVVDPQIMSQSELTSLQQLARQHQVKTIIFSKNNSSSLLGITKFVSKPDQLVDRNYPIQQLLSAFKIESSQVTTTKSSTIKVMLVDDAALMKVVISNLLNTDSSMKLIGQAANGEEAISKLKTINPDVILLDIEMPVMDGLTFLQKARSQTKAKIIVLSSIASQKASKARFLGADAIMDKPSGAVSMDLAEKSGDKLLKLIHSLVR